MRNRTKTGRTYNVGGVVHQGVLGGDGGDAKDDCQDGGDDVVEDCAESNLPGERKIHGSYKYQILAHLDLDLYKYNVTNSCDEGGNNQRDDDALQHVQEKVPDELDVHGLSLAPAVLGVLQSQSKSDA